MVSSTVGYSYLILIFNTYYTMTQSFCTIIYLTRGMTLEIFDHYPTQADILAIGFREEDIIAYEVEE